jgi:hypothetical protein
MCAGTEGLFTGIHLGDRISALPWINSISIWLAIWRQATSSAMTCANEGETREHGRFITRRIGTEKPQVVRPGNYICVRDEGGYAIYRAPISPTAGPSR